MITNGQSMENPIDMVKIANNVKSGALIADFIAYCNSHRSERFWQALRNWSGADFIYQGSMTSRGEGTRVVIDGMGVYLKDTFDEL